MVNSLSRHNTRAGLIPALIFLFLATPQAKAQEIATVNLSEGDRILVVAPHPDDEILATGGIIQEAIRLKLPLKIVYLTNGDSNELAYLFYKKRPLIRSNAAVAFGEERVKEAEAASDGLGVKKEDRIFLGYPDYGLLKMFTHYWKSDALKGVLTRARRVPYAQSPSKDKAHTAQNILEDLKKVIQENRPTKIFVSHPADLTLDHQAAFLFVQVALWDLRESPQVLAYMTHDHKWPSPQRYAPDAMLLPPANLEKGAWVKFFLNPEQIAGKQEALEHFQSQIPYRRYYLKSFVRRNELFSVSADITVRAAEGDVRLAFPVPAVPSQFPIEVYILGYKSQNTFGQMPKIVIKLFADGQVVYDGYTPLRGAKIRAAVENNVLSVVCPLSVLGNPEKILTSVKSSYNPWPSHIGAWKILTIDASHAPSRQ